MKNHWYCHEQNPQNFYFTVRDIALSLATAVLRNREDRTVRIEGELLDHSWCCLREALKKKRKNAVSRLSWFVYYDTLADSKRRCYGEHHVEKSTAVFFLWGMKSSDTSTSREIVCHLKYFARVKRMTARLRYSNQLTFLDAACC